MPFDTFDKDKEERTASEQAAQDLPEEELPNAEAGEKAASREEPDSKDSKKEKKRKKEKEPTEEEKLAAQLADLNDKLMRTLAEYDNFRKRSQKEKDAIYPRQWPIQCWPSCRCWTTLSGPWQPSARMPTLKRALS